MAKSIYDKSVKTPGAKKKTAASPAASTSAALPVVSIEVHGAVAQDIINIMVRGNVKELAPETPSVITAAVMARLSYEAGSASQRTADALVHGKRVHYTNMNVNIFEAELPAVGVAAVREQLERDELA